MKIKVGDAPVVSKVQLPISPDKLKGPRDLGRWVQTEMQLDRAASRVTRDPAQPVTWGDRSVVQPEHWSARFTAPHYLVDADYWKGGTFVSVERREQNFIAVIEALHRANGTTAGWILLADTVAGSLVLLSITGVILWTELNRRRTFGALIFFSSIVAMIAFAMQSI